MTPARLDRLRRIADAYDLFLVDQWGVLHDGAAPFPHAAECLRALRSMGRKVILLSNASRRAGVTRAALAQYGIDPRLVDHVVTSGEEVWRALRRREEPFYAALGRRCLVMTWRDGDEAFLDGLELDAVTSVSEAEFLLNLGTRETSSAAYDPLLEAAAERGLPMVCANHDFVSIDPAGGLAPCPGAVARRYEALGGRVRWHGKPLRSLYDTCRALAPEARRPLAIGDSLFHDVGGATAAGIDSVLVASGIHRDELEAVAEGSPDSERLAALCAAVGAWPDYVMPTLAW